MFHKQYSLRVKQPESEIFNNIENEHIKETISQSSGIVIESSLLLKEGINTTDDRVFICSDVCGSVNVEESINSESVPSDSKYYFLSKIGSEYKFLKQRPLPNRHIVDTELLLFNGDSYIYLRDDTTYGSYIQPSIETITQDSFMSNSYRCFSFNFGGISKTSSIFYTVDNNGVLQIIDTSSNGVIVDYVEGNLYMEVSGTSGDIASVIGIFNIDPIIVDKKGSMSLTETNSTYYKFLNNADKGNISLKLLDGLYVLSSIDNIYIFSVSDNVKVDGIRLASNYKLFIPKNTNVVIELNENEEILVDDYVSNIEDIRLGSANYDSNIIGDHLSSNNIVVYPSRYSSIYIVKEIEKNTYNFERPSILSLQEP